MAAVLRHQHNRGGRASRGGGPNAASRPCARARAVHACDHALWARSPGRGGGDFLLPALGLQGSPPSGAFGLLLIRLLRTAAVAPDRFGELLAGGVFVMILAQVCLLYTSDAADE